MLSTLITLIDLLDSSSISETSVIQWGAPIPYFGDFSKSRVATLGLNPSNREFFDDSGNELKGRLRRFHTLNSLGLDSWSDINARHLSLIYESCQDYFKNNPYDRWFRTLDTIISAAGASFYSETSSACHLDLIPYSTLQKWADLSIFQRSKLLSLTGDTLGILVRESPIKVLILNGKSVIDIFQDISNIELEKQIMSSWSLPRYTTHDVIGMAYWGITDTLSDIQLGRNLLVLGFNHNLQSSFGVTTKVIKEIEGWVLQATKEYIS
jgi:hypothetical protein